MTREAEVERLIERLLSAEWMKNHTVGVEHEQAQRRFKETRTALLAALREPEGEEFMVMRVNGAEDTNDPHGQRYIKSMLVISSDLSADQGRKFRISDGELVRVTRIEEGT